MGNGRYTHHARGCRDAYGRSHVSFIRDSGYTTLVLIILVRFMALFPDAFLLLCSALELLHVKCDQNVLPGSRRHAQKMWDIGLLALVCSHLVAASPGDSQGVSLLFHLGHAKN